MFDCEKEFYELVAKLRKNGYDVEVRNHRDKYLFAVNIGKVVFGFSTPNSLSYSDINGRICAEADGVFNGWNCCILTLPFPKNIDQLNFLLCKLSFLSKVSVLDRKPMKKIEWYPLGCTYGLR